MDGCDRPVIARGWCKGHWQRWKRTGEPGPADFRTVRLDAVACSVDGCERPHEARGWCSTHYVRWRVHGDPLADVPVTATRNRRRYIDQEMSVIADPSVPAAEAAEAVGVHAQTVLKIRQHMRHSFFELSDWIDAEIDFLIVSHHRMSTKRMAEFLGRPVEHVQVEMNRLRTNGIVGKRSNASKEPHAVGGRPLLAKTCPHCGKLLDRSWFQGRTDKKGRRSWETACKACKRGAYGRADEQARHKARASSRSYYDLLQAYTAEHAVNSGNEWTSADLEVISDPSMTTFSKAMQLKRTYAATQSAVHKHGASSRPQLGDPEAGRWHLFWEFPELDDLRTA